MRKRWMGVLLAGLVSIGTIGQSALPVMAEEVSAGESETALLPATNLRWTENPSVIEFDDPNTGNHRVGIDVYRDGKNVGGLGDWNYYNRTGSYFIGDCLNKAGRYTYRITFRPDIDSDEVVISEESPAFDYVPPAKLPLPSTIRWYGHTVVVSSVEHAHSYFYWLYEKEGDKWVFAGGASFGEMQNFVDDMEDGKQYAVQVKVISENAAKYANSGWSEYVPYGSSVTNPSVADNSDLLDEPEEDLSDHWEELYGRTYWYEDGVKQGTADDPQGVWYEGTNRGREIYDPESDAWYWLDAVYDGAKATGKEVFMPYVYSNEKTMSDDEMRQNASASDDGMQELVYRSMQEGTGKWVRYDEEGRMLKGWVNIEGKLAELYPDQAGNTYYYDNKTGLMAKGWITLSGQTYHFDETTGALIR